MNMNVPAPQDARIGKTRRPGDDDKPAKILVVDDVPDNRDILTRRLARRGFEIVEAGNGTEALDVLSREDIDLVLLDIMMPDIEGTEIVREIRKTRSQTDLPIIMVSAKTLSEDVAESLELGANDYVIKPVDFTVALARIRAQLDRKRAADEVTRKTIAERAALRRTSEMLEEESSSHKRSQGRLQYLAFHDDLTGLMNRVAFRDVTERALSSPAQCDRGLVLLFIDLDRFKAINDVYGHDVGDQLLKEVGARLRATLTDTLAFARLGGDEFAALVAEDGVEGKAMEIARAIIDTLGEPFEWSGQTPLQIGASVGAAPADVCDFTVETLMKAADLAMYRAKSDGRCRAIEFDPRLLEQQRERSLLEVELRRAIELGEFEVHYQPLLDAQTRDLSCFEALVRWRHPEKGLMAPGTFIPAAEESGLINALGAWVLRRACADAAAWSQPVRVAVNLSPEQFRHPDLISTITDALAKAGLEPDRLEVEITESCLLDAGEKNVAILCAIRELGVRVAIDDFGTGYSSMAYLQNFVFDKLKIDRRFVSDLDSNSNTSAIINAIVQLGTTIGIKTTAEGIETEAQLQAVISHGCSEVQGFLLSEPIPAAETGPFIALRAFSGAPTT